MTNCKNSRSTTDAFQPSLRGRLLQCAAASAAAWALVPTAAHAAVPPECDEQNAPNIITCVVPAPDEVGPIEVDQDNTTIVIGDANTPTTVLSNGVAAIDLDGNGAQTVIVNRESVVSSLNDTAILLTGDGDLTIVTREGSFVAGTLGSGAGIVAEGAGNIQLTTEGNVFGSTDGIVSSNSGDGSIIINATGQTTGQTGFGIAVLNLDSGTDVSIDTVGGAVNAGLRGILANNTGSGRLDIATSDVTATSDGSVGIVALNEGTNLTINTREGSVVAELTGISAVNTGTGLLSILTADVTAKEGTAIEASNSEAGDFLRVHTRAGTVTGRAGIDAANLGSGSTIVRTDNVFATDGDGIVVGTSGSTTTAEVSTVNGVITARQHGIFLSHSGTGLAEIRTSDVTSMESTGVRLFLDNPEGAIIDTTNGTVQAGASGILVAQFGTGLIDIDTADVIAASTGISVDSETEANIDTTQGSVVAGGFGIAVGANGDGGATIRTADVTSENGAAIRIFGKAGDILILTEDGSLNAATQGINVSQDGAGGVAIRSADITADTGILVESFGDGVLVETSSGAIDAATTGIVAGLGGTGSLLIRTGDVTGLSEDGIVAGTGQTTNAAFINTVEGAILGRQTGIDLSHAGTGQATVTTGDVAGETGNGVSVLSSSANVKIDTSAGDVRGGINGVAAQMLNSGSIEVVTGDVESATGNGIVAGGSGSDVAIDSRAGTVSAGNTGIAALNSGTGSASILSADVVTTAGTAVRLENAGTASLIDTSAGDVTGATNGIVAAHGGSEGVSVTTGHVTAQSGFGVTVGGGANGSGVMIDTSAGSVTATSLGIAAVNFGTGDLDVTTGDVTSSEDTAIQLTGLASGNQLLLDTTAGTVTGTVNGIFVEHQGSLGAVINTGDVTGSEGAVLVSNQSADDLSITTGNLTSANGTGLVAANSNLSQDMMIDTSGGAINAGGTGITAISLSSGSIEITSGDITAQLDGILFQTSGGDAFITNAGAIEAGGFEIAAADASVGAITIVNNGRIVGNIALGSDIDSVTNNGTFVATADSAFGAGEDIFSNAGTLAAQGTVAFTDLEQLTNGGEITLVNGDASDALSLSGDYAGAGGQFSLDVALGAASESDTLIVGGAATGTTTLNIALIDQPLSFGTTTVLVDAGEGTQGDAFALAGGDLVTQGLLSFALTFDADENDFLLGSAIGPSVFRPLKIAEGAQALWHRSADAWAEHIDSSRHADHGERKPVWGQIYGATSERDEQFSFVSGGFSQDIVLDYSHDFFGLQLGVEFGPGSVSEGAFFGATAGYLSSQVGFESQADRIEYDVFNLGLYAGYRKDSFFAHGLAKYDFVNADVIDQTAGYTAEVDGGSIGARFAAGYRLDAGTFFVEPSVSLEYQSTDLDDFNALGADFDLANNDSLRGIAGVRLGGVSETKTGALLTYYGSANAVHEFAGEGDVIVSSPASSITLTNDPIGTYARFDLGLNIATKSSVTGFIEGNADIGSDYSSFGGRAGLRINF